MTRYKMFVLLVLLTTLAGCAANNRKQLEAEGINPLTAEDLYEVLADRTLHLTSADFDSLALFMKDGTLSARNRDNEKDTGEWDITTDNELCMKFSTWLFGDLKCYSIFPDKLENRFIFFTANGARSYNAEQLQHTPGYLAVKKKKKSSSYLKQKRGVETTESEQVQQAPPQQPTPQYSSGPLPSNKEMKHLLAKTASNCPGCNLAGTDLSRASLIGANLAGADLSGANLKGANLRRANLTGANLEGADLTTANLPGANLTNCNLRNANFSKANLVKADLTGALTEGADFSNTHLEGIKGL